MWSENTQETCWTLWKATVKEMRDTSILFIYSWAPKAAVWPEVLMGWFECGFRGNSGGFSPGQGCHQSERRLVWERRCVCTEKCQASRSAFEQRNEGNLKIISASLGNNTLKPGHTPCDIQRAVNQVAYQVLWYVAHHWDFLNPWVEFSLKKMCLVQTGINSGKPSGLCDKGCQTR